MEADELFAYQYRLVKESRKVVFDFCHSFREDDYSKGVTFDGKSIRQLHIHVANTYRGWLLMALQGEASYFQESDYPEMNAVHELYTQVDHYVSDFLHRINGKWNEAITLEVRERPLSLTPARLFTHVMTHEFHHKGQILILARGLGYPPPDTDIIRF